MILLFLPGYQSSAWFGIGATKNTPAEIIQKLNTKINLALADPQIRAQLVGLGHHAGEARPGISPS
jgi:tripartite-type tricarboxylate transporter receptor subunit TctC